MSDTQTVGDQPQVERQPPFVQIAMNGKGGVQVVTNLNDKTLVLGLLEAGKFALMLQDVQLKSPLIKPANGLNGLMQRLKP